MPTAPPVPLAGVSEAALRGAELREGAPLEPGARLPCTVSFTRGQERAVALTVAGLPPARPPPVSGPAAGRHGVWQGWYMGGMHGSSPRLCDIPKRRCKLRHITSWIVQGAAMNERAAHSPLQLLSVTAAASVSHGCSF